MLRHSLATQELTIDGIRPPPANVVFSIAGATPTVQTVRQAGIPTNQVRIVNPGTTVVRPAQVSTIVKICKLTEVSIGYFFKFSLLIPFVNSLCLLILRSSDYFLALLSTTGSHKLTFFSKYKGFFVASVLRTLDIFAVHHSCLFLGYPTKARDSYQSSSSTTN